MNKLLLKRIFIESISPLAVHSGEREVGFDTQVAKDWNDLPYIPATSIAGSWRSMLLEQSKFSADNLSAEIDYWFGTSDNSKNASRITVTDGLILNDKSQIITDKLLSEKDKGMDKIFSRDLDFNRDRCRITHRGTAANRGKFDVAVIPAGVRFSFDISVMVDDDKQTEQFEKLTEVFSERGLRFGSNKTNGLGAFKIIHIKYVNVDLSKGGEFVANEIRKFREYKAPDKLDSDIKQTSDYYVEIANLSLRGCDSWSIGKGDNPVAEKNCDAKSFCYTEQYLKWKNEEFLKMSRRAVVCGSMLKGVISHRIIYHFCKISGIDAGRDGLLTKDLEIDLSNEKIEAFKDLRKLFGFIKDQDASVSALLVDEAPVGDVNELTTFVRAHNRIDYFTGGVIPSALFSEERVYKPTMNFRVLVKKSVLSQLSSEVKNAIKLTLYDLREGFLPVAAGSGREAGLLEINDVNKCVINDKYLQ